MLDGHANKIIPFEVMGGTTRHLLSLFDSIRMQRNDAIHQCLYLILFDFARYTPDRNAHNEGVFSKQRSLPKLCLREMKTPHVKSPPEIMKGA